MTKRKGLYEEVLKILRSTKMLFKKKKNTDILGSAQAKNFLNKLLGNKNDK